MASTDHFRLRIGGNNDDGYVEIATNDNGNESIYVRQYGGNGWNMIKRTATLLDGNGNTTFPGTVNASSFSGNATSATKATNDSSNRNIVNTYATKVNPAFSGTPTAPTPGTSDNGTRIATTGFVHNILNRAVGKTEPTLTSLINWDSMKSANGGTDVRNIKNTTYGTTAYGGDAGGLNKRDIILKKVFNTFDAILIEFTNDGGDMHDFNLIPKWLFSIKKNTILKDFLIYLM